MKTSKTTGLTIITIAVCLILLLIPDPYRDKPVVNVLAPSKQVSAVAFEIEQFTAIARQTHIISEKTLSVEQQSGATTETVTTALPNAWMLDLYPQLDQISLLDNQPPNIALIELLPMLSDTDPVIRLAALESVADTRHPASLPILTAALNDFNPQIRVAALEALTITGHASVAASIEPYVYDRELEVRIAAIDALGEMENEIAADTLGGLLGDGNTMVRHHAVNALGEIGGGNAISYLLQARYDADETIRANANAILEE